MGELSSSLCSFDSELSTVLDACYGKDHNIHSYSNSHISQLDAQDLLLKHLLSKSMCRTYGQ